MINNNTKKSGPASQLHVGQFMYSSSWDPAVDPRLGLVIPWCYQSSYQHATGHRSDLRILVWLIILGGNSAAHSVNSENLEDNTLNFDLVVPVKSESKKSQSSEILGLLN